MGEKNKKISHKMMIPFKAYDGDGDYIFISYKHADSHLVYPIIKQFHDRGFNVWHDGGLPQGNNYDIQIANHIKNAYLFVNFITQTTMDCANDEKDYMIKEFNIALNFDKVILPIYLEDVELDGFYLVHLLGIQSIFKHEYGGDEEFFINECIRAFEEKGLKPISSKNVSETPLDSYPDYKPVSNTGTIDYGIDLGTDYSCIAKVDGNGTVIVPNCLDNKDLLSSAVWIKKHGTVYVGDIAKNMIARDPFNGYFGFKLKMGTDYVYKFKASGKEMTPVELSAEILKNLRQSVKQKHQKDLRAAVITVPVDFISPQTEATTEAAKLAGFKKVILLQEPTAAAMAYGFNHSPENESWLIYDFGDTFDVSILKNIRGEIINIANEGDTYLGGRLIDWDIVDKILVPEVVEETGLSDFDRNNKKYLKAFAKLKNAAEKAKTELSTFETADIEIENLLFDDDWEVFDFEYEMTREELNQVMKPYVDRSIKHCRKALENANLDVSDVSKIILVGKSSLSPYIQHRLVDEFNTTIEFSIDPTTVVARGAAVFAGTQIDYTGE